MLLGNLWDQNGISFQPSLEENVICRLIMIIHIGAFAFARGRLEAEEYYRSHIEVGRVDEEMIPQGRGVSQAIFLRFSLAVALRATQRKREEEKARYTEQQHLDFAPRQRLDAHCVLCETLLGGQKHYGEQASTVLTRSRTIWLLPVSLRENCIDGNTFSVCRRVENASQVAEIVNGVYGADTVTANYVPSWFRLFRSSIFDVKDTPCTGRPVVENVDKIKEIIEVDRHISSCSIAQELKIDHKTVLSLLRKVGFKKKLDVILCYTN
ncbi:histone-lysine N-methyltransferase SETMAR [Trichonephila clavipes]|nr:histone-lysine N-methyltransferase SETMAR [Trichonephila clavipes]